MIYSSLCKIKLLLNQEEITKTNKNQIKLKQSKPKLKAKQPVKAMKQKKYLSKKERNLTNKNGLPLFVNEFGKRVQ